MTATGWTPVELEPGFKPMEHHRPLSYRYCDDGAIDLQGAVEAPEGAQDGDLVGTLPEGPAYRLSPERIRVSLNDGDEGGMLWTRYSVETDGRILYWPTVPEGYEEQSRG